MTQADLLFYEDTASEAYKREYRILYGFDPPEVFLPRARNENPASSHIAAAEIEETAESQCKRILAAVVAHPDCTTQELAPFVKLSVHTVGRRLPELRTKGLICNPYYGDGRDAMQLRRCTVQNRLALTWRAG